MVDWVLKRQKGWSVIVMLLLVFGYFFIMGTNNVVADFEDGDYTYVLDGDPAVATIVGYTGDGGPISIPSTVGGYPVRTIGESAFSGAYLTSVTIPSGVTGISNSAFSMCNDLTSVNIPSTVQSIGSESFAYCGLTSVTVPNGVTAIGDGAFQCCYSLTSVTLADSVSTIGYSAFEECSSLTSVKLPRSMSVISGELFGMCSALTSITIPSAVTAIQYQAFENCGSMTVITFNGNAPTVEPGWIDGHNDALKVFFYQGSSGFTTPTWEGIQTEMITLIVKPAAPTSLRATSGDALVQLSWTAPTNDGGAAIDHYVVYQNGVDVAHVNGTQHTLTGLTNGVNYNFAVAAHNSAGIGLVSNVVSAMPSAPLTVIVVPGVPTGLTAMPADGQVHLSWTAPLSNGGSPIDYYVVYRNGADVTHEAGTSTNVSGLINGVSYSFTVAAHNSAGVGAQSEPVSSTPSATIAVPGSPTGLNATPGNGQVQLSWTAPASNGGAPIDYYIVYQDSVDVAHVNVTTATMANLINGVSYSFTVAAHNSAGVGSMSNATSVTPNISASVPGSPTGLNGTFDDARIHLQWNAPDDDGDQTITEYRIYRGTSLASLAQISSGVGTSYLDSNISIGQTYYYRVSAVNAAGEGDLSSEESVATSSSSSGSTASFFDTVEGQVAVAGLLVTAAGAIGYALWRRKR